MEVDVPEVNERACITRMADALSEFVDDEGNTTSLRSTLEFLVTLRGRHRTASTQFSNFTPHLGIAAMTRALVRPSFPTQ